MASKSKRSDAWLFVPFVVVLIIVYVVLCFLPLIVELPMFQVSPQRAAQVQGILGRLGSYGDMFGIVNGLFSGGALAGVIYTLVLQRRQVSLQQEEIDLLRAEIENDRAHLVSGDKQIGKLTPTKTPGKYDAWYDSIFVKVSVQNAKNATARDCRAYLMRIEERVPDGFRTVDFYLDALRLRWAYEDEETDLHKGIDIPQHVPVYFDIFSTKDERAADDANEQPRLIQTANTYLRYEALRNKLAFKTTYKFHLMVVAENSGPLSIQLTARLGEDWSDVEVLDIKSPAENAPTMG